MEKAGVIMPLKLAVLTSQQLKRLKKTLRVVDSTSLDSFG